MKLAGLVEFSSKNPPWVWLSAVLLLGLAGCFDPVQAPPLKTVEDDAGNAGGELDADDRDVHNPEDTNGDGDGDGDKEAAEYYLDYCEQLLECKPELFEENPHIRDVPACVDFHILVEGDITSGDPCYETFVHLWECVSSLAQCVDFNAWYYSEGVAYPCADEVDAYSECGSS